MAIVWKDGSETRRWLIATYGSNQDRLVEAMKTAGLRNIQVLYNIVECDGPNEAAERFWESTGVGICENLAYTKAINEALDKDLFGIEPHEDDLVSAMEYAYYGNP
jgi:hypothetical protein